MTTTNISEFMQKQQSWEGHKTKFRNYFIDFKPEATDTDIETKTIELMKNLYDDQEEDDKVFLLQECIPREYGHILWFLRDIEPEEKRFPCDYFYFYSLSMYTKFFVQNEDRLQRLSYYNQFAYYLMQKGFSIKDTDDLWNKVYDFVDSYQNYKGYPEEFSLNMLSKSEATQQPPSVAEQILIGFKETVEQDEFFKGLDDTIRNLNPARFLAIEQIYRNKPMYKSFVKEIDELMLRLETKEKVLQNAEVDIANLVSTLDPSQFTELLSSLTKILQSTISDDIVVKE